MDASRPLPIRRARITLTYDADGRVNKIAKGTLNLLSSIAYMPFGQVSGWTEGSGATYARTIDQDGRISVITISGTSGVPASTTLTYTLDNSNRVTNLAETGLTAKTFGYDYINRLTSFNPGTSISYSYDASSNRTAAGSTTYTMSTTSNRLASLSTGTTYSYDADGHMTGDGTHTWTYDQRGRLTSSTTGGVTTTYGVNGLGQRVTKAGSGVPSGGTNEFVYDGAGHLIGEYGSTGTIIEETVYLGDMPVAVMTSGGNYQVDPDNINAPHIITNQTGNRVWFWDHLDFGNNAPNQNPSGLGVFPYNLRFPGQYADAETGLNYNMFRDYNPTLGRYVESDPIGLAAGINTYGYVGGNPVTNTDPLGLVTVQVLYKPTPWYARLGYPDSYHAYIVVTDNAGNGQQTYFRAGPAFEGYWQLYAQHGEYKKGSPDWAPGACSQTVLSNDAPAQPYIDALTNYSNAVDNTLVFYNAQNTSNSFVSHALPAVGLPLPTPPVSVPGW